jgi:protein-tyrosine-phosphatase
MKWVTRARPKVDRVACPWLIRRFVDPAAEFLYVPADEVPTVAEREGAVPFDVPGVEFGHHGDRCSFDAILRKYRLDDAGLQRLALIVRGADTDARDLAPEAAGLEAIAEGFRLAFADDQELLEREMPVYDALYAYCRQAVGAEERARAAGTILFVCPHGAAKSVLAAAYFNRLAAERGLIFRGACAGTEPDPALMPTVVMALAADGLDLPAERPRPLTTEMLAGAHRIITMGCDVARLLPERAAPVDAWDDVPAVSADLPHARAAIVARLAALVDDLARP